MKESLVSFIQASVEHPKEEEIKEILDIFQLESFQKGAIFKHANKSCEKLGFLISGCARFYTVNGNGRKITGRIVQKNNFVTDCISLRTGEKASIAIETLEATTMLVTSIENMKNLLKTNLTFNKLIREHITEYMVQLAYMHLLFLNGTAKERYQFILKNNPSLTKKFPLHFIANMIGVTPTQLSRIRKKIN